MSVTLILACAGKGVRADLGYNKLFFGYFNPSGSSKTAFGNNDKPLEVFLHSLYAFIDSGFIDEYIIAAAKDDYDHVKSLVPDFVKVVIGGKTRTDSVKNALKEATGDVVLIHDGARPFVTKDVIEDCIRSAEKYGSGIAAVPSSDTICAFANGVITAYLGKTGLYRVQTPQGFKTELIKKAYALSGDAYYNDDGQVYKEFIGDVHLSLGDEKNIKLTNKADFEELSGQPIVRTGIGFDCHKLVEGRKLIIGGIQIPFEKGLLGHSDADVLTHAIMDSILSACALRDIGYHFPDTDEKYKNADSILLLKKVTDIIKKAGYKVKSIAATVLAEKPKLKGYIDNISRNIARAVGVNADMVGIGATTLEGLGFVGREEGICAQATAVVEKIYQEK